MVGEDNGARALPKMGAATSGNKTEHKARAEYDPF
jgi:hypothetical protein